MTCVTSRSFGTWWMTSGRWGGGGGGGGDVPVISGWQRGWFWVNTHVCSPHRLWSCKWMNHTHRHSHLQSNWRLLLPVTDSERCWAVIFIRKKQPYWEQQREVCADLTSPVGSVISARVYELNEAHQSFSGFNESTSSTGISSKHLKP